MKYKGTVIGAVALLACLAGWVANNAVGQGEQGERPSAPTLPPLPPPGAPAQPAPPTPGKLEVTGPNDGGTGTPVNPLSRLTPLGGPVLPVGFQGDPPAAHPVEKEAGAREFAFDAGQGQSNDNPTGRQEPAVSLEWIGPPTIKLGQPVTFQIIIKNVSPIPVQQVVVRNRIPAGVTVQATEPKAFNDLNVLTWDLGTLQPRQERRLDLQVLPEVKGDLTCQATVTFTGTSTARIKVREPKLTLKASGPDKILLGDVATVTLTVNNPGDGSADHVKIKAGLSEGLEHTRGHVVEFDLGNLGPNESRSVQLVCATKSGGTQTCEAKATAEANLKAEDTAAMEVILPRLDLTVTGPKLRYLDRKAVYVFKITNPGSAPASNVMINDQIPDGFKFLAASDGGRHDFATRTVSWFVGDLTPGQSREVNMEVLAINTGEHHHKANVTAARGLKSEAEVTTRVEGLPALLMELVDLDDPVEVGADTAYEIRITNTGSKTETNLQLICTIPEKMEFRGAVAAANGRFRLTGKELVFEPLPRLAPRADAIYRVNVRGIAPGDLRFRARITADGLTEPVLKEESTKVYGDDVIK
ncbi:MAG TPA: hypothetical protein VK395_10110 [Gemmataceae bacterium]|nr:hypothetical protein [Gemmataceae bacterium]